MSTNFSNLTDEIDKLMDLVNKLRDLLRDNKAIHESSEHPDLETPKDSKELSTEEWTENRF